MVSRFIERYRLMIREARTVRVSLLVAGGMNLLAWGMYIWFVAPRLATAPFFSLHYTVYFGVDRIGAAWRLASMPAIGLAVILVNSVLMSRLYTEDRLATKLVAFATVFFTAMLLWVGFLNILLNA